MKLKAFKAALPLTAPICVGFLFVGMSYGLLMNSLGFSFVYPMLMSAFIFAGSMQFVTVNLFFGAFEPIQAFLLTIMVNARHIFYGISMLDKYKNTGLKKLYLIFGLCDETFSINCIVKPPEEVDKSWFMFFVTLINHVYWIVGSTIGAILGNFVTIDIKGIEFVMTALFVVMFINQWEETSDHKAALIGIGCSVLSCFFFGRDNFLIPSMIGIILCFTVQLKRGDLK